MLDTNNGDILCYGGTATLFRLETSIKGHAENENKKIKKNTKLSAKRLTERRLRNDSVSEGERSLETRPVLVIVKQGSRGGHAGACRVRNKNNELKM